MYIQDVGEVHVGVGKMWVPQFGDLLDGIFEGMTGCLQMEMLMRDSGRDCDVACGAVRWEAKLRPKRTSLLSRRLIGCLDRALHHTFHPPYLAFLLGYGRQKRMPVTLHYDVKSTPVHLETSTLAAQD